jgi:hypothetical protein
VGPRQRCGPVGASERGAGRVSFRRTVGATDESRPITPSYVRDGVIEGVPFGESARWHDGQVWFSDWGAHEVIAFDPQGGTRW